jgi:PAS domain S-box-containing protein
MITMTAVQLPIPAADTQAFRADLERLAADLALCAGARGCMLVVAAQPDEPAASVVLRGAMPDHRAILEALAHLQGLDAPQPLYAGEPLLALPLLHGAESFGQAVLIFDTLPNADDERIAAAGRMAAMSLHGQRRIADLQLQAQEIAERTRLREIQMSRNLIRGVIDGVPMGLVLLDSTGTILAANRALSDRFGLEPAAMVGRPYADVLGDWDASPASRTFSSRSAEKVRRTMQRANGAATLLEIASIPLLDTIGQPHQVVEVWEDITERVALQTQLVRAEKLAAIGHLAASIAHEVGNPLQAIQGFLSLFLEQSAEHMTNRHFLELAEEEIERIVQVLARLRDLYRPRAEVVALIDFNELIRSVLLLTSKQLERGRIRVLQELDSGLEKSLGVADQFKQVLLNLVLNAADAMPEGGVLHVQSYMQRDDAGAAQIVLAVTDTGVGIPPGQLAHLFDGLHTTKERGMGLGLYTSRTIVERHQGRIEAQSRIGEGTTFTIALPVVREEGGE